MIVQDLTELEIFTVLDRGVPNKESIAIRVNQGVELGQFGVFLGLYAGNGLASPLRDNFFWFGDGSVQQGDWIFIDTGVGEPRTVPSKDGLRKVHTVFWNKARTVFANSSVVPVLFRIDAVHVLEPDADLPQGPVSG